MENCKAIDFLVTTKTISRLPAFFSYQIPHWTQNTALFQLLKIKSYLYPSWNQDKKRTVLTSYSVECWHNYWKNQCCKTCLKEVWFTGITVRNMYLDLSVPLPKKHYQETWWQHRTRCIKQTTHAPAYVHRSLTKKTSPIPPYSNTSFIPNDRGMHFFFFLLTLKGSDVSLDQGMLLHLYVTSILKIHWMTYFPLSSCCKLFEFLHIHCRCFSTKCLLGVFRLCAKRQQSCCKISITITTFIKHLPVCKTVLQ